MKRADEGVGRKDWEVDKISQIDKFRWNRYFYSFLHPDYAKIGTNYGSIMNHSPISSEGCKHRE